MNIIEQHLVKLSNTSTLAQITILDNQGDEDWHTGRIYLRPEDNGSFRIFETDGINMLFKPENIVRLKKMTEVYEHHCISDVVPHKNDN